MFESQVLQISSFAERHSNACSEPDHKRETTSVLPRQNERDICFDAVFTAGRVENGVLTMSTNSGGGKGSSGGNSGANSSGGAKGSPPNGPSQTGKPSGDGRGNNPPRK